MKDLLGVRAAAPQARAAFIRAVLAGVVTDPVPETFTQRGREAWPAPPEGFV